MSNIFLVTLIVIVVIIVIVLLANNNKSEHKRTKIKEKSSFKSNNSKQIIQYANRDRKTVKTHFNGEDEVVVQNERHLVGLAPTIFTVPSVSYPTIQSAIDAAKALGNPGYLTIEIKPGTYDEFITIEGFNATPNFTVRAVDQGDILISEQYPGFQILGDRRPYMAVTYVNGYERAGDCTRGLNYVITTNNAGGPYNALLASSFGAVGGVTNLNAQNANPITACSPLTNTGLNGQIAIIRRGTCGFAAKALTAQNAGAAAAIIFNSIPGGPIVGLGGTDFNVNIPVYSLSNLDGLALSAAVNSSTVITVTPVYGVYNPPLGTNYGMVELSHPGGDRSQITVSITSAPIADDNILATPVIEQPNFNSPQLGTEPDTTFNPSGAPGIIPGDFIVISDADIVFSNTAKSLHQITAVSGNTITFTPPVDPVGSGGVDITGLGANITFLPNVRITKSFPYPPGQLQRPIFRATGVGFSAFGLWIDQDASQPFGNLSTGMGVVGTPAVTLGNIAVTDVQGTTANDCGILIADTHCYCFDGYRDTAKEVHMAVVGWAQGIQVSSMGELRSGHIFVSNTQQNNMEVSIGSKVGVFSVRLHGAQNLYQAGSSSFYLGRAGGGDYTATSLSVSKIFHVTDSYGPGINIYESEVSVDNPGIRVERCYNPVGDTADNAGAIVLSKGSKFTVMAGAYLASNGQLISQYTLTSVFKDNVDLTPVIGSGFSVPQIAFNNRGGVVKLAGQILFENNNLNVLNEVDGTYSTPDDDLSPENILQVSTSGTLNAIFERQKLESGASLIQFDPAAVFNQDYLYVGKSFLLFSDTPNIHYVQLLSGTFMNYAGATVLEFKPKLGAYVRFTVVSPNQVLVEEHCSVKVKP